MAETELPGLGTLVDMSSTITFGSIHTIYPAYGEWGTSKDGVGRGRVMSHKHNRWSHVIPDYVCVFTARRGAVEGSRPPSSVVFDQIPRLMGEQGGQIGKVFTSALITQWDRSGCVSGQGENTLDSSSSGEELDPTNTTCPMKLGLGLPGDSFGFLKLKRWVMCCSAGATRVSVRTILLF